MSNKTEVTIIDLDNNKKQPKKTVIYEDAFIPIFVL